MARSRSPHLDTGDFTSLADQRPLSATDCRTTYRDFGHRLKSREQSLGVEYADTSPKASASLWRSVMSSHDEARLWAEARRE